MNFLNNDGTTTESFLEMFQFGPWDVQRRDHIDQVAGILLAYTLSWCK